VPQFRFRAPQNKLNRLKKRGLLGKIACSNFTTFKAKNPAVSEVLLEVTGSRTTASPRLRESIWESVPEWQKIRQTPQKVCCAMQYLRYHPK
jgi:hypothetical protein